MAPVPDGRTQSYTFAPEHQDDIADPVEVKKRKGALSGRTYDPEPLTAQGIERPSEIHDPGDAHVKMCSRRAFNNLRGHPSGSVLR